MAKDGKQQQKEASRRRIERGLLELLEEKDFEAITITEIARQADVARKTIYRLYRGKIDILRGYFARLCETYLQMCKPLACYEIRTIAEEFFSFWYGNRKFLLLLHRKGLDGIFYEAICEGASEVIQRRMDVSWKGGTDYFVVYSTGGFVYLLYRWMEEGMKTEPKFYANKVCEEILQFVVPAKA